MSDTIFVKNYAEPPVNPREILRYAGYPSSHTVEGNALLEPCLAEARGSFRYAVCWREVPVTFSEESLDLSFVQTPSEGLRKNLRGCRRAVIFAATVGVGIDRLIAKYSRLSPTRALMMQAIGAERIESLCDAFCEDLCAQTGCLLKPRFSPGYGDLPLEIQRDFFAALDCPRKIGLSLNESLLLSPSKSVTAIVGITADLPENSGCNTNQCASCSQADCAFRG